MAWSLYITDSEYLQQHVSHSHLDRPVSNESKPTDDAIKDLLGMEDWG